MKADKKELFDFIMERNKNLIDVPVNSLREWISKCSISVTDLSVILGIHRSTLHKLMAGNSSPSETLMNHIKVLTNGKIRNKTDLIDCF